MGINSKAIERIDKQIRMLKEDYTCNDIDDSFEEETEEFVDTDFNEAENTMKLNHIDDIEENYDTFDDEDTTKENIMTDLTMKDVPVNSNNNDKLIDNNNEPEDGVNIFLVYYIGIIIIAIFSIIVMYFLFT